MNSKAWIYSLVAGAIGGFASAGLSLLAMPDTFSFSGIGLTHLYKALAIGILVPVFTFLKQSPLPTDQVTVQTTATQTVTKGQ
jgi:hypothetical protein